MKINLKEKIKIIIRQPDQKPEVREVDRETYQEEQNNRRILEDQGI